MALSINSIFDLSIALDLLNALFLRLAVNAYPKSGQNACGWPINKVWVSEKFQEL